MRIFKNLMIFLFCVTTSMQAGIMRPPRVEVLRGEFNAAVRQMQNGTGNREAADSAAAIVLELLNGNLNYYNSFEMFKGFDFNGVRSEASNFLQLIGNLIELRTALENYKNSLIPSRSVVSYISPQEPQRELSSIEDALRSELLAVSERQYVAEGALGDVRLVIAALHTRYEQVRRQCSILRDGMQIYENYFFRIEELLKRVRG